MRVSHDTPQKDERARELGKEAQLEAADEKPRIHADFFVEDNAVDRDTAGLAESEEMNFLFQFVVPDVLDGMKHDSTSIKVVFAAQQPWERQYRVRLEKCPVRCLDVTNYFSIGRKTRMNDGF